AVVHRFVGEWNSPDFTFYSSHDQPDNALKFIDSDTIQFSVYARDKSYGPVEIWRANLKTGQFMRVSSLSTDRPIFTRAELEAQEDVLMDKFVLWDNNRDGCEDTEYLYTQSDKSIENIFVPYKADGISILLPYNPGWGAPHYMLTPFDR